MGELQKYTKDVKIIKNAILQSRYRAAQEECIGVLGNQRIWCDFAPLLQDVNENLDAQSYIL